MLRPYKKREKSFETLAFLTRLNGGRVSANVLFGCRFVLRRHIFIYSLFLLNYHFILSSLGITTFSTVPVMLPITVPATISTGR